MQRLLFPLPTEINNIHYASGSFASIYNSLKKYFELIPVGPLKLEKSLLQGFLNRLNDYKIFPWRFATMHSWKTINGYSRQLQKFIDMEKFDAIFCTSTLHAASVKTDKPVFAFTDFSYINALDYYSFASNLFPSSREEAIEVDKYCFGKYSKVFLASDWAKNGTVKKYNLPSDKIVVVGRGANLESGYNATELVAAINDRIMGECKNFLFVGRNWHRKGGDIAYSIVKKMLDKGMNVKMQIVGCNPPARVRSSNFVKVFSYLNRNDEQDLKLYKNLFKKAFMFILPTKNEAMGIAFNEASSFGLPSISYNTGGVGAAIENSKSGILFEQEDSIDYIVSRITSFLNDSDMYRSLAYNAYNKFKNENNWDTIALKLKKEIENYLA